MSTLVLVIAGDQIAKDVVGDSPASALSAKTGKSVKIVDVSSPTAIRGGDEKGAVKTVGWFVQNLSSFESRVNNAVSGLDDWEPAGVWWMLGVADTLGYGATAGDSNAAIASFLSDFQSSIETLLAWNPFGEKPSKSYVSLLPSWGEEVELFLTPENITVMNGRITSASTAAGGVTIEEPTTFPVSHTRKRSNSKDWGLSSDGASALADAFATATAANLDGGEGGEGGEGAHVVPVTETVTTYTKFTETITRNKLAGLEGKQVVVLADGKAIYGLSVGADGSLTLPFAAQKVIVGLPYDSVLAPMPLDTDNNEGSTLGKRRAFGRCVARVYRSFGGQYAASKEGNLYDVNAWKTLEMYDIPVLNAEDAGLISGDIEFILPSGQDPDSTIWIVSQGPYPLRIVSIMAELDFGEQ